MQKNSGYLSLNNKQKKPFVLLLAVPTNKGFITLVELC